MKRKVVAAFFTVMIILSAMGTRALAADPFPIDQFQDENSSWYVYNSADPDYLEYSKCVKDRYPEVEILNYAGYRDHDTVLEQKAHYYMTLPEGFADFLENSSVLEGSGFYCDEKKAQSKEIYYEGVTGYNEYTWNTISYNMDYIINACSVHDPQDKGSIEGYVEALISSCERRASDRWGEDWKSKNTDGVEPVTIEKDEAGNTCIIFHKHTYEHRDTSVEVKGYGMVYGYGETTRDDWFGYSVHVIPGTRFAFYTEFSMSGNLFAVIYDPRDTDYEAPYEGYKQRYKEFCQFDFARPMAFDNDLVIVRWEDPVYVGEAEPTEEPETPTPEPTVTVAVEHSHKAEEEAGEDGGALIPVIVVVGVLVAGGGAAYLALKKKKDGSNGKEKEDKSYRMYVKKDFGNTLPRGSKNVPVGARIAEKTAAGTESDRPDLTQKITAAGTGLSVKSLSFDGRYAQASIDVPPDLSGDTASVTFSFTGEGGIFSNTVEFKITDNVKLRFTEETAQAGAFVPQSDEYDIEAIWGDGFTYKAVFMLVDAVKPVSVSDISAEKAEGFDVSFEETGYQNVFRMIAKNMTRAAEPDVFAEPKKTGFAINARIEGMNEPASGYVNVTLYPEGISISSRQTDKKGDVKYVGVQAYEKDYVGALDNKWQVTEIAFILAIKGEDRAIIDPEGAEYTFEKIKGAGGLGSSASAEESLASKYEYREETGEIGGRFTYTFEPNAHLCEPEDGTFLMVMLPVSCTCKGEKYTCDVPLRLCGKVPDPFEGWDEEYKKLLERVEKYSLPEDRQKWENRIQELVSDPRSSTEQLRLTSKIIVRNYMRYWLVEGVDARNEAELYEQVISQLEWLKFFGDCAFSLLVGLYAGPVAEAVISPAKDFFTEAIGEVIAAWNHGEKIDAKIFERFEFAKNLAAAGDNIVGNNISLTNWKKAAATLGCYLVYSSIKNYIKKLNDTGESDLYGALVNGFTDMTAQAFKAYASKMFEMWMKNSKTFQDKIGPWITKYFKETKIANLQMQYNNWQQLNGDLALKGAEQVTMELTEVLNKFLTELVGLASAKAQEIIDDNTKTSSGFGISPTGSITFTFTMKAFESRTYQVVLDLNSILMNVSCPLFGWLYDLIFGQVPVAASVVQAPKDPPLPPEKK